MTVAELLRSVAAALDAVAIPYMVTGSVAAAYYGAGRATMDVDVVIDPSADQLNRLTTALDRPGVYVSSTAAAEALELRTMFNVVDATTGWKADLIIRKDRPYSVTEFERRREADLDGVSLFVARIEDVIVSKLEWAKLSGSARQLEDVAALLRVNAEQVDMPYLNRWIAGLGVAEQWAHVRP